jgi:hypothetical protein
MQTLGSNLTQPLKNQMLNEHLYILRAMFYALTPNETYIEKIDQVPDIPVKVKKKKTIKE